jgi:pyridoxamine 5'-phosphate oxidase
VARWIDEAVDAGAPDATAVQLATVGPDGRPAARTVLLKGLDERGFSFFTNHESRKGRHLAANPACAMVLFWRNLDRQVTVTGDAERLPDAESDDYFASRPRGSQIGAWASHQSSVLPDRDALDAAVAEVEARFAGEGAIPRPPWWGGYVLRPDTVELWQGRDDRLHDRIRYTCHGGAWTRERLSP